MADLQRYELADVGSLYNPWREMRQADDGEWCEFEEAEKRIAELEAENERLASELSDWQSSAARVMEEVCTTPDEHHCSCVPLLRNQLAEVMADARSAESQHDRAASENERLREAAKRARFRLAGVSPADSWDTDDEDTRDLIEVVRALDAALDSASGSAPGHTHGPGTEDYDCPACEREDREEESRGC